MGKNSIRHQDVKWEQELKERGIDIAHGDYIINKEGAVYEVVGFALSSGDNKPALRCQYFYNDNCFYTLISLDKLSIAAEKEPEWRKLYADIDTVFLDAIDNIALLGGDFEKAGDTSTTDITVTSDYDKVLAYRNSLQEQQNRLKVMEWSMKRKMNALRDSSMLMKRKLKYTEQTIRLMELFLGVYEDVVVLRDGEPAPISYPVNIRQLVLYMDEEVGTIRYLNGQRGIDFRSIEEFDDWLISDESHIELVIPEAKGIVALRPSRQKHNYSPNFLVNLYMNNMNSVMYLLVRNGKQLYRICTDINIGERLFPSEKEMDAVYQDLSTADKLSYEEEKARDKEMSWRYKLVLIQGLLERTSMLTPLPPDVSVFNPGSFESGDITLIRDAESINLPDGRLSFKEWRKQKNEGIRVGSRIVITDAHKQKMQANKYQSLREGDAWLWRYSGNYYRWTPSPPEDGVYTVVDSQLMKPYYHGNEVVCYKVLYMPEDRARTYQLEKEWGGNPSQPRRQGFWVRADDNFVLNYDAFNLDDIEYYVTNRIYRSEYLSVIPQLFNLRDLRLTEMQEESELVINFARRYCIDENTVWRALEWWKTKNKLQRPIRGGEDKAWRMIRRHLGV